MQGKGPSGGNRKCVRENVLCIPMLISEYKVFREICISICYLSRKVQQNKAWV